ncbi:hypothetical protein LIA77_08469 [Sarocladium implicatum]|nr:hypothetical protein LIA77_08469 [Sarocladium implicatum]
MDSSLFNVHHSASVSGPVSATSVSVSASTSSVPAATGHLLPGAGHVDAVEEDDVSLDSNASTADHHNQHQQSDPDPGAGSGAGPVAPWLANIKRRAPIACRRSVLPLLACHSHSHSPPGAHLSHLDAPKRTAPPYHTPKPHPNPRVHASLDSGPLLYILGISPPSWSGSTLVITTLSLSRQRHLGSSPSMCDQRLGTCV